MKNMRFFVKPFRRSPISRRAAVLILLCAFLTGCNKPENPPPATTAEAQKIVASRVIILKRFAGENHIYGGGLQLVDTGPGQYRAATGQQKSTTVYVFRNVDELEPEYIKANGNPFRFYEDSEGLEVFKPDFLQRHPIKTGGAYDFSGVKLQYVKDIDLRLSDDQIAQLFLNLTDSQFQDAYGRPPTVTPASEPPVAHVTKEVTIKPADLKIPGSGEIHDAAKNGDLVKITALLKDNPNLVSSRAGSDITPLHLAAMFGHKDVALLLLSNHAEVNAKTTDGITPLYLAASVGQKDIAEVLLAHKAEVDAKDNSDQTPLHEAAGLNQKDVVELLLAHKAEVNAKDNNGHTPLQWAVANGHKDVAEVLLAYKAEVDVKDNDGKTPLEWAAANGHKDVAVVLLTHGAAVNAKDNDGVTPLCAAAIFDHKDVAELLLASKANVNVKINSGDTPLHLAIGRGYKDMVELLLTNGADVNAKDNKGETPLHWATQADIVELLRQHGGHE